MIDVTDREDDVFLKGRVQDTGRDRGNPRSPEEESTLRLPRLRLPAVDEQDEADDDEERKEREKARPDEGYDTR